MEIIWLFLSNKFRTLSTQHQTINCSISLSPDRLQEVGLTGNVLEGNETMDCSWCRYLYARNRPPKKNCFGSNYCLVIGPISSSSSLVLNILTPPQWNLPIFIMCWLTVEVKLLPSHTDLEIDHHLTLMITFQRDGSLRKILLSSKTGKRLGDLHLKGTKE